MEINCLSITLNKTKRYETICNSLEYYCPYCGFTRTALMELGKPPKISVYKQYL